jgi:squalene-hopene/tetraprenyl-beta-curcumene cyclase
MIKRCFSRLSVRVALAIGLVAMVWVMCVRRPEQKSIANEPFAPTMSLTRSAEFLDDVTLAWIRRTKCASCHTGYPYLIARPALGDPQAPALVEVRNFFDQRVVAWDIGGRGAGMRKGDPGVTDKSEGVTEVVAIAATLALYDSQATAKLRPITRQALDRMWTLQLADGHWTWNNTGLAPLECDEYFGAVYAAVGVGHAPDHYATSEGARDGVGRLKTYLQKNPPPNLHHQLWLAWASLKLNGLLSDDDREQTVERLVSLQRADGGWCLPSLGDWSRPDDRPHTADPPSDGYATGLAIYVMRRCGMPTTDEPIQRGVDWLKSHQRTSGGWFTHSLNWDDAAHRITNAGTAWAAMALKECGE